MTPDTRHPDASLRSARSFGFVMTGFFALLAAWPLLAHGAPRWWAAVLALVFLLPALLLPRALALPARLWLRFGDLLSSIVSPIMLAILFYGVITPYGWLMRVTGKKTGIALGFDKSATSYWIRRDPPGPEPESLKNQF